MLRSIRFFQKAVETPIHCHPNELEDGERVIEESIVIDIEQENLEKTLAENNIMKLAIHEVNHKWHPDDDEDFRKSAGCYALSFLRSMNGTLCYLTVALRMLAKAPWVSSMVSVHVRQAAIYAISQGWYVNTHLTHGINFCRAELALAAGTFQGDLTPNLPDDSDYPLFLVIHELPHNFAELFSRGSALCKCCGGMKEFPVPTFATEHNWTSTSWAGLRHCLENKCTPFPWIINPGDRSWHRNECLRDDVDVIDIQFGPWMYVSFRTSDLDAFPQFSTISEILQDASLEHRGLAIKGFICSNVQDGNSRHYWFLEVENGKIEGIYDLLNGLCPVTVEISKKLRVTGIVLIKPQSCKSVLKSRELELKAGKPVHKERRSVPIEVKSRNLWLRSTQQTSAHCLRKVRKTSSKHNPSEQPLLGKVFAKTKTQSKAKGKAKGKASWPMCCTSFAKAHRIVEICDDPANSDAIGDQISIEALRKKRALPPWRD